jgi:hypothetical protein
MRTRTRPSFALLASGSLVAFVALAWVGACSNQGEGGVCDPNSDDCGSGLTCQTITGSPVNRCCPVDRTTSTTQICQESTSGLNDANAAPQDSGASSSSSSSSSGGDAEAGSSAPDALSEATTETSADAPAESSSVGAEGTGAEAPDGPTE